MFGKPRREIFTYKKGEQCQGFICRTGQLQLLSGHHWPGLQGGLTSSHSQFFMEMSWGLEIQLWLLSTCAMGKAFSWQRFLTTTDLKQNWRLFLHFAHLREPYSSPLDPACWWMDILFWYNFWYKFTREWHRKLKTAIFFFKKTLAIQLLGFGYGDFFFVCLEGCICLFFWRCQCVIYLITGTLWEVHISITEKKMSACSMLKLSGPYVGFHGSSKWRRKISLKLCSSVLIINPVCSGDFCFGELLQKIM